MGQLLAPQRYVEWMNQHLRFNPRGQQQSDFLSRCIVDDLRTLSIKLSQDLDIFRINYHDNMTIWSLVVDRVVDMAFADPKEPGPLNQARLCVEHKTIMTAHGKARKNRVGDLIAYCNHTHNHSHNAIAGATIIINTSSEYENPDGFAPNASRRQLSPQYIRETMELFTKLPLRESVEEPSDQPEALAVILVSYDGVHPASLVTEFPALPPEDPNHYDNFCRRLARLYEARYPS